MSTAKIQTSDSSGTHAASGKGKKAAVVLLGVLLLSFLGLASMSLMAAQKTERQRVEVGMAGGECEFEHRVPTWLQAVAGEDCHSFMDYPVIVGITMTGDRIDDADLGRLPIIDDLRTLDLQGSQVTTEGMRLLSKWKNIRRLNLGNTPVTDITPLAAMPNLEALQLNFSQVRREHLAGLSQLKNLRELGAGFLQVTDQEVIEIARCPQLQEVNISAADLGEHGLQPLTSLEQLEMLVLIDAKVNSADLDTFKAARPDVEVLM